MDKLIPIKLLQRIRDATAHGLHGPLLVCVIFISSCASIPATQPRSPKVTVIGVTPLNLSLIDTKLIFKLLVSNPNSFDLPVRTLDFDAFFAEEKIAHGLSKGAVTVPAQGEAVLEVTVSAGLSKLMSHLKTMFEKQDYNLKYSVRGNVKLANWPARIPFNYNGDLDDPANSLD